VMATRPRCATLALGTIKAAIKKYRDEAMQQSLSDAPNVVSTALRP